ncbi:MAG: peptidoglycan bridge formation glycyltransferase FemA/FemB family protein [Nitrospira sp.]|nr:peptidoglycan bridge formation glycyltransferase FemA/FemB family protein [Nitrospira sp.]
MVNWNLYGGQADGWDKQLEALGGGFYQSYGWGEVRRVAGWQPVRLLATSSGQVVAAASVLSQRRAGIPVCWIPGGPVGPAVHFDAGFRSALGRSLGSRIFYCRMSLLRESQPEEKESLARAGWKRPAVSMSTGLTMLCSLKGEESERLKRTSSNWRHNLKRSGHYGLRIERWEQPDPAELSALYREMEALKSLPVQHSEAELEAMLINLGERLVMFRCLDAEGKLLAVRAAGLLGDTAWDLLAAAGANARKVYASHATLWALLDHCSRGGLLHYDLSGVDPILNKGVYDFKQGTGARLVECLGEWEWASLPGMCLAFNWVLKRRGGA